MALNWKGKRVLVAGGAGTIGSHMSRELVKRGAEVTIASNYSSGSPKNVQDLAGKIVVNIADLRDERNCMRETKNKDYVIQLSATVGGIGFISEVGADIMRDNLLININMLNAARKNKVKRFFFPSSAYIYPEQLDAPLKESDAHPASPDEFYGWEKLMTEKICEAYQRDYNMDIRIARFNNILGECYTSFDKWKGKAPCHTIIKAIKSARNPNEKFLIWGDGEQSRCFLDVNDCVSGVLKLIDSDYSKPINIGAESSITMNEMAAIVIKLTGKDIKIEHDLTKPQGVRGRNVSIDLARKELKWEPKIKIEESIKRIYEWATENYSELENI